MKKETKSDPKQYTKPELRDRIKKKIADGDKGGNPGQWSARKAQIVTHEYEKAGGSYKQPQSEAQKNLKQWGDEKWTTSDKKTARRAGGTTRYLPEKAWEKLSEPEKKSTNRKKVSGSKQGQQFVGNTQAAAKARKQAGKKKAASVSVRRQASAKRTSAGKTKAKS